MRKHERGFTLIELLIVVAIIGILAAIAIPNLLTAMQRSKQKRTMADIRAIALAWEARSSDMNGYAAAGATWNFPTVAKPTPAEMLALLSPTYIKSVPGADGWNRPYTFGIDQAIGTPKASDYGVRSSGNDGAYEGTAYTAGTATKSFDCDIVYSNGSFIQWPEGVQTK